MKTYISIWFVENQDFGSEMLGFQVVFFLDRLWNGQNGHRKSLRSFDAGKAVELMRRADFLRGARDDGGFYPALP